MNCLSFRKRFQLSTELPWMFLLNSFFKNFQRFKTISVLLNQTIFLHKVPTTSWTIWKFGYWTRVNNKPQTLLKHLTRVSLLTKKISNSIFRDVCSTFTLYVKTTYLSSLMSWHTKSMWYLLKFAPKSHGYLP